LAQLTLVLCKAPQVRPARRGHKGKSVRKDRKARSGRKDHRVKWAHKALRAKLGQRARLDRLANRDLKVSKVLPGRLDPQVRQAPKAPPDQDWLPGLICGCLPALPLPPVSLRLGPPRSVSVT